MLHDDLKIYIAVESHMRHDVPNNQQVDWR